MTKMNPEIKVRWVAALRSGEYLQGKDLLRGWGKFCCLGVLCDLYAKDHNMPWKPDGDDGMRLPIGGKYYPPDAVRLWAGFHEDEQPVAICGRTESVAVHNDGKAVPRRTFEEIATAIEEQL